MPRQRSTKRKMLSARVPPDLIDRLQAIATDRDRPVSWVIERALEEYCAREERGKGEASAA